MQNKKLVLFSGGIDSAVLAEKTRREGDEIVAISIAFSPNSQETRAAKKLASQMGISHHLVVDVSAVGVLFEDQPKLQMTAGACQRGCEGRNREPAPL